MKKYTKKQITEAIAYWEKQLEKLDEKTDPDIDRLERMSKPQFLKQMQKMCAVLDVHLDQYHTSDDERKSIIADFQKIIRRVKAHKNWVDYKVLVQREIDTQIWPDEQYA